MALTNDELEARVVALEANLIKLSEDNILVVKALLREVEALKRRDHPVIVTSPPRLVKPDAWAELKKGLGI